MAKLTVATRDELLIRLDERMKALKDGDEGDIPEIKNHLAKLNGGVTTNTTAIKYLKWSVGGLVIVFLGTLGAICTMIIL